VLWGGATVIAVGALLLAWRLPIGRPAPTPDSPYAEMGVVRYKGAPPAPDFSLSTLEGQIVTLSALRGRVVFLNFWATWCPPCREGMPSIERLHLRAQGLVVLAVDVDESPERVAKFVKDFRLGFPVRLDAGSHVFSSYGAPGLPTTILIDRKGRVIGGALGPRDWASNAGRALMRTLLEQQVSGGR
jgi:thiol-disulfide isomerase/thioredoxin